MNWSEYKAKKGKTADFVKKKEIIKEAVEEVKDSNGNVTTKAEPKVERDYITMVQKAWNPSSGEQLNDRECEWLLTQLESEKKRYDADMKRAKEYSDGLAEAIKDYKAL